ncbi:hypothetical protein GCM10007242_42450 [Pigmentiphaga litoralis]|uniref:hypothetical protein n=1 Tax=Pigmentiphaga litoralis TaxID=516702 RepID=UPI001676C644|nr:hypothetical protein [Pigmentiphaga litoralis]GGX31210.1 hypothetical protein GCM10007242_42450 [Pigmentiphaga litoralis]
MMDWPAPFDPRVTIGWAASPSSDWPHTNREPGKGPLEVSAYRKIAGLVDAAMAWMPDASVRQQVMVDNPARLYGF